MDAPADVWIHDLQTTSQLTELWPWLLVLALLLWPLDIALRRVSLGRRELADGRRWIGDRVHGRRVAARTEQAEGLFAARERAGASSARSAIMREAAERPEPGSTARRPPRRRAGRAPARCAGARARPAPPAPLAGRRAHSAPAPDPGQTPAKTASPPAGPEDTLARLREAKRRSRG